MKILVLIREPYLDKIPSLKTLLWYLAERGNKITIISSYEEKYPELSFETDNIKIKCVKKRTRKFELPTMVKLGFVFIQYYILNKPNVCIGGDTYGNLLLGKFKNLINFKHVYFLLEFPQIITKSHPVLSKLENEEARLLNQASFIITHDEYHKNFLLKNFNVSQEQILLLPNSTFTHTVEKDSFFLQRRLNIGNEKKIILHSGGLGVWFRCKELANSTIAWNEDWLLVFHTSHNVSSDSYFNELISKDYSGRVSYSTKPVTTYELDSLISSAFIGIALYSIEHLDYRAELMGLAAGKIGNYLKCGLPVIATNLESLVYIENYQCGILVNNESEISLAIEKICLEYDMYSKNAIRCFQELWFPERYLIEIDKSINNIVKI